MKTLQTIAIAILILFQVTILQAQSYEVKNYKMSVAGTSTLHDWESSVESIECNGAYTLNGNTLSEIENVVLKIKVTEIKSTKGKMMDNKTYEAFNYEKNPFIIFKLKTEELDAAESTISLTGDLTMAGVTKTIGLTLTYKILAGGDLQITGSQKLSMTAFGMEPPTAMMGTIKVGNEVTVKFDMTLTNNNKI
jgi:hypothetical protein